MVHSTTEGRGRGCDVIKMSVKMAAILDFTEKFYFVEESRSVQSKNKYLLKKSSSAGVRIHPLALYVRMLKWCSRISVVLSRLARST